MRGAKARKIRKLIYGDKTIRTRDYVTYQIQCYSKRLKIKFTAPLVLEKSNMTEVKISGNLVMLPLRKIYQIAKRNARKTFAPTDKSISLPTLKQD